MKTAIILGATGLVGRALVQQLLQDDRFARVVALVRRDAGIRHPKLSSHIVNFDGPEEWKHLVSGDVLLSTLGTTMKQAGSKEEQYKVDFTYQYEAAKASSTNGVESYVLVSSAGASPRSRIFYSRMKGELEEAINKLSFSRVSIIRPGLLSGHRSEQRTGEKLMIKVMNTLCRIPGLSGYEPIAVSIVARAMINAYFHQREQHRVQELREVFDLAEGKL